LFGVLIQCDKTLFKGKYLTDLQKTHSPFDLQMICQIKKLEEDVSKYISLESLNST